MMEGIAPSTIRKSVWDFVVVITSPIWLTVFGIVSSAKKLPCFSPDRLRRNFTHYRRMAFVMEVIWVTFSWSALTTKVYSEGITGTAEFFTNISLMIQAIYYSFDLFTFFGDPDKRVLEQMLLSTFFFPIFANSFDVFFMVLFVFIDNANIFTSNLESAGGKYNDGLVFLMERAYHVFPLLVSSLYMFLRMGDIVDVLVSRYGEIHTVPYDSDGRYPQSIRDRMSFWIRYNHGMTYIAFQYVFSIVPFALYIVVADVKTVYDIDIFGDVIGFFAVLGLNLIAICLVIYTILFFHIPTVDVPLELVSGEMALAANEKSITLLRGIPPRRPDKQQAKIGKGP